LKFRHLEIRIVVAGFAETWECFRGALRGMMTNHSVAAGVGSTLAILYAISIHPRPNGRFCRPMLGKPQRRDLPVQASKSRDRSRKLYPFKSGMLAFFLAFFLTFFLPKFFFYAKSM
jgi:hypothetical protein